MVKSASKVFVAVPPASLSRHPFHIPVPGDALDNVPLNLKGEQRNGRAQKYSSPTRPSEVIEIHEGHLGPDGQVIIAPKSKTFVFSIGVANAQAIPGLLDTIFQKAGRPKRRKFAAAA